MAVDGELTLSPIASLFWNVQERRLRAGWRVLVFLVMTFVVAAEMASCGPAAPPQRHRDPRAGRVRGGSVTHGSCRLTGVGRPNRSSRRGGACSARLVRLSAVDEHRPGAGIEGRGQVRR